MSTVEHKNDASLSDFLAGWSKGLKESELIKVAYAVIGLTNFGEYPVQSTQLAEILGRSVSEAEVLAQQWGWPGTRVENGLISVDPERAKAVPRRHVRIGHRQFGVTGCAPDVFLYAPLVRPSLQLEETCPTTGTPMRIVFTPSGVESVDPSSIVVPMLPAQALEQTTRMTIEEIDANLCVQGPFFSSAEAAHGWLAAYPGGRIFPVRELWDLSPLREWRDRMSALLNLD